MGTLYECLREARLEKFYPAFRANGITRSEALINLGMPEFCALGITGSEDKRRLIELVNIIKSVHNSGLSNSPVVSRRNVIPRSQQSSHFGRLETESDSQPQERGFLPGRNASENISSERLPNFSVASYADMLEYLTDSSESDSTDEQSDHEDHEPVNIRSSSNQTVRSSVTRAPVERIQHSKAKSYNYGVHKVSSTSRSRSNRSNSAANPNGNADEKIKVCVRKRGLNRKELRGKDGDIVSIESTTTLTVNEPKLAVDLKAYTLQHEFIFDEVFDEVCSNENVYIRAARPLISCVFNGMADSERYTSWLNISSFMFKSTRGTATCFAYGQTGAGKTYTMLGNEEVSGLYLLAGEDIFSIIQSGQYGRNLHVWVSYFEIYCGQLFDLLNRRNRLFAREDGNKQVCIAGLTETEATSVQSLIQIMNYGNSVRSKGATGVNPDSSRSHAILQLDIRDNEDVKLGKISFIDLAGSERGADMTDTDRQTRFEGAEINQSLLALKECIRSIDQESRHTPFRQSKLTHILKDSFVGNSRTCMIANISPAQSASENTLNTLRYADRVKELKRDSVRSSTVGRAMNLLMNIPPNAPSIFHPSNILSSSTPTRRGPVSRIQRPNPQSDIVLDPSETPIRGHNLPRKPTFLGGKNKIVQSHSEESRSHQGSVASTESTALNRPRPPRSSSLATAASQAVSDPPPDASPSESDQTDTDSCNITNPANLKKRDLHGRAVPVARSSDTEYDFPTSDFNNYDEINDLNRPPPTCQEGATGQKYSPREKVLGGSFNTEYAGAAAPEPVSSPDEAHLRHTPVMKPVLHNSRDNSEKSKNSPILSSSDGRNDKTKSSTVTSPKISTLTPTFTKAGSTIHDILSSDSIDEEDLLAEGPADDVNTDDLQRENKNESNTSTEVKNLVILNKSLMAPLPANSCELTKFTQRPALSQPDNAKTVPQNNLSYQAKPVDNSPYLETSSKNVGARPKSSANGSDQSYPLSRLAETHNSPHKISSNPEQQDISHTSSSPLSDKTHHSPQSHSSHDISEPRRRRRASHSPSGEVSDDSTDSIRASFSDQGPAKSQPGTGERTTGIGIRKERSDPMLALSMQRKKHTLPDPQNISRKLMRGTNLKTGLSHNSSGLKGVHTDADSSSGSITGGNLASAQEDYHQHTESMEPVSSESVSTLSDASTVVQQDQRFHKSKVDGAVSPPGIPSDIVIHKLDGSKQFLSSETTAKAESTTKKQSVITTQKLASGAIFSPIHPQPVTSSVTVTSTRDSSLISGMGSSVSSMAASASTLHQPTPVTASTVSWIGSSVDSSLQEGLSQSTIDARQQLVSAHEDQLATITSLCKYEMRLLLNAKKATGRRGFEDYLKKVNDILEQKLAAISALQDEINRFHNDAKDPGSGSFRPRISTVMRRVDQEHNPK